MLILHTCTQMHSQSDQLHTCKHTCMGTLMQTHMHGNADATWGGGSITIITVIIYAFRNFSNREACSGMEPHLHNSADLIRGALAPNDVRLAHFRSGVLSAYRWDLKPQEKISINGRHGPVSHSSAAPQLHVPQGQNTLKNITDEPRLMCVAAFLHRRRRIGDGAEPEALWEMAATC